MISYVLNKTHKINFIKKIDIDKFVDKFNNFDIKEKKLKQGHLK